MSDRAAMTQAHADVVAKALLWREQVREPVTRAESELRKAVDTYLAEIKTYTGFDVSKYFQNPHV